MQVIVVVENFLQGSAFAYLDSDIGVDEIKAEFFVLGCIVVECAVFLA